MESYLLIIAVLSLPYIWCDDAALAPDACTYTNITHCSIENGHANCSYWDISEVVDTLPMCTTSLHFTVEEIPGINVDHLITFHKQVKIGRAHV